MHSVYLLTGSNQGNRKEQLEQSIVELELQAGTIIRASAMYETEAWGIEGLPSHLNQALLLETRLSPAQLLSIIHGIENKLGRIRQQKWGVRAIDIDIIYFDNLILNLPELVIPHPLMQQRNFVLAPLAEIAPDFVHPILLQTNKQLLEISEDKLAAKPAI
jgi:2-amino-4-hydroxy-6-hydroxymethyldihydropteridine diphosphokinase